MSENCQTSFKLSFLYIKKIKSPVCSYTKKIKSVIFVDCFFKPISQRFPIQRLFFRNIIKNTFGMFFCVIIRTERIELLLPVRRFQIFTVMKKEFPIVFVRYQQRFRIPKPISLSDKFFYFPIIFAILKFKIGSSRPFRTT